MVRCWCSRSGLSVRKCGFSSAHWAHGWTCATAVGFTTCMIRCWLAWSMLCMGYCGIRGGCTLGTRLGVHGMHGIHCKHGEA
eukprot:747398-Pelagomonas_calceolata.AAC.1